MAIDDDDVERIVDALEGINDSFKNLATEFKLLRQTMQDCTTQVGGGTRAVRTWNENRK